MEVAVEVAAAVERGGGGVTVAAVEVICGGPSSVARVSCRTVGELASSWARPLMPAYNHLRAATIPRRARCRREIGVGRRDHG